MNLLVDSGNSLVKWALSVDQSFVKSGYSPAAQIASLHEVWKTIDAPDRVLVSNVAGQETAGKLKDIFVSLWQLDAKFLASSRSFCGLTSHYHEPEQLGVDRWMAMLAAYQQSNSSVIIIDCGTAVTIDLVNENGHFRGGVIMPGLHTAIQSLQADTDAVKEICNPMCDISAVTTSTEEGVVAGVLLGLAGGIERVVREQSSLIEHPPVVYITGGDAEKLIPHLTIPVVLQAGLVLQGLRAVAEKEV